MPDQTLRGRNAALLLSILVIGVVASIWVGTTRSDCGLCLFNIHGAVLADGLAALGVLAATGYLAVTLARDADDAATSSLRTVLFILAAAVVATVIGLFALGDRPWVSDGAISGTVAGLSVGVAALYVALGVLFVMLRAKPADASAKAIPPHEEDQHVLRIEGIGHTYATRLNIHGIITIPQLLETDPMTIAKVAGCQHELAEEWQAEGRLMQVKGIGPQFAEIIAMAGVRTVQELASSDVDGLLHRIDAIEKRRRTRVVKVDVNRHHVEKFIEAAGRHIGSAAPPDP